MKQNIICSYEEAFYVNHHDNIRNKHFCAKKDLNVFMEKATNSPNINIWPMIGFDRVCGIHITQKQYWKLLL